MSANLYEIRECQRESCRFRFPVTDFRRGYGQACPLCGEVTDVVVAAERELERIDCELSATHADSAMPIEVLIDNVRSVFNVGSIFRTADGVGIPHIYLAGISPTPDHPKFAKTALGAEESVAWSHANNGVDLARRLVGEGRRLWGLEDGPHSERLFDVTLPQIESAVGRAKDSGVPGGVEKEAERPIVLVVGHEVTGIDPGILELCERVLSIPMHGIKRSLNVAIAFSIAAYWFYAGNRAKG